VYVPRTYLSRPSSRDEGVDSPPAPFLQLDAKHVPSRPAPAERELANVETFVHLLGILYTVPIDDREFLVFKQSRTDIAFARRSLAKAQATEELPGGRDAVQVAQDGLRDLIDGHVARLERSNAARRAHLERFEAALRLLHEPARQASSDGAHSTTFVFLFMRLQPVDQAAVVESAREFLYTACIERAVHGRALDPVTPVRPLSFGTVQLHDLELMMPSLLQIEALFGALKSSELDSAWRCELVSHDLDLIVHFYRSHDAPMDVVDCLANLLNDKKPSWAANLFPRLAVEMQQQAVFHCRKLLLDSHARWEHEKTLPDANRMVRRALVSAFPDEVRARS